jgi:hypothetical protein
MNVAALTVKAVPVRTSVKELPAVPVVRYVTAIAGCTRHPEIHSRRKRQSCDVIRSGCFWVVHQHLKQILERGRSCRADQEVSGIDRASLRRPCHPADDDSIAVAALLPMPMLPAAAVPVGVYTWRMPTPPYTMPTDSAPLSNTALDAAALCQRINHQITQWSPQAARLEHSAVLQRVIELGRALVVEQPPHAANRRIARYAG